MRMRCAFQLKTYFYEKIKKNAVKIYNKTFNL